MPDSTIQTTRLQQWWFVTKITCVLLLSFQHFSCALLFCVLCRQCIACSRDWISLRIVRTTIFLNCVSGQLRLLFNFCCPAGFVVEPLFNAFATAAFFEFVNFAIFEMQYLLSIWRARRGPALDTWQTQRELAILYIRFYGALLCSIFVTYQSQRWVSTSHGHSVWLQRNHVCLITVVQCFCNICFVHQYRLFRSVPFHLHPFGKTVPSPRVGYIQPVF